jgi:Arc/MetJ-type ribon-helix-helix transcriptional regulator
LSEKAIIGFDYSHSNILTLESSSFAEFTQFIFASGYKIARIQAGFKSVKDLEKYRTIIISTPKNATLKSNEVEILEEYVRKGGSLLIVSSSGGDYSNKTNLNDLTQKFGFEFVPDEISDSVNYLNLQKRPIIENFKPHIITEQIQKIVFSSSCSVNILEFLDDEKNIKVEELLISGLNGWHKTYDGKDWVEEDNPKIPLLVAVEYFEGRVVGFGNISIFSSLTREYGFTALDNDILIANVLNWLASGLESEGKSVTIELNLDLYYWVEKIVKEDNWKSYSDLINVSLKNFRDNYQTIIEEIKRLRQAKLDKRKAFEKTQIDTKESLSEESIIEKVPMLERKKEDLEDIMSALEEVTGEHYELSIDIEGEMKEESKIKTKFDFTDEEIKEFEKGFPKKAIWHGKPTKAFTEWLEKRINN